MFKFKLIKFIIIYSYIINVFCNPIFLQNKEYDPMHPKLNFKQFNNNKRIKRAMPPVLFEAENIEKNIEYWHNLAQKTLSEQLNKNKLNKNLAKNIILFLGDGMSIPTLAATRIYMGGEDKKLSFEELPYTGLSKTYCANSQVADSACTATAYLGGIKSNYGTIGLSASASYGDCSAESNRANHVKSIAKWAQNAGMSTGFVTTTHVTHASPAGVYAHTANRDWEYNQAILNDGGDPTKCTDIAKQLIHGDVGRKLKVILGGGRSMFLPDNEIDIEGVKGKRTDGLNLIKQWKHKQSRARRNYSYVENKNELLNISTNTNYLFGLFDSEHLPFHLEADLTKKPTLTEMLEKALDVLEKDQKGYFLFVEGGRIDHGHHYTQAIKALDETVEFSKAIDLAKKRTIEDETLIVVTSDHSHTMTISGYSSRGNDILGINDSQFGLDNLPYATLSYANGPGYNSNQKLDGERVNLNHINMHENTFEFPSTVPLEQETHGGDDVAVFASGPWGHLFTGIYEQNYIPHAMAYAACIGHGDTSCKS